MNTDVSSVVKVTVGVSFVLVVVVLFVLMVFVVFVVVVFVVVLFVVVVFVVVLPGSVVVGCVCPARIWLTCEALLLFARPSETDPPAWLMFDVTVAVTEGTAEITVCEVAVA